MRTEKSSDRRHEITARSTALSAALIVILATAVLIFWNAQTARAAVTGEIRGLENAATAYREKDSSSEVLHKYAAGDTAMVIGEDEDWMEIYWRGETGYIPKADSAMVAVSFGDIEQEAQVIQEEMEEQQDKYESKEEEKKKAIRWRVITVILVIAIVAISLVPAILRFMHENTLEKAPKRSEDEEIIDLGGEDEDDLNPCYEDQDEEDKGSAGK